ncbi:TFIIB-type zinc ribbon-containing protein [Aporhodopirellula aestuarii]|uniref:Zf-TFIIB domain-containing protein n=1 Tax=Aporhodopirellula aestuarii TaxID=2950107 RepID=A0ABT0U700_9BACT|nr:zf-TFIIB domain-containing protein [Aporhodopirellula aestuarii]MCM2372733.1 zf-TFIIB domain-containing protein [Aporhodopirellula aestuarii]
MTSEDKKSSLDQFFASLDPESGPDDLQTNTENGSCVPEGERPCPICGEKMATDTQQGIQVDLCHDHGIWLDKGELGAVIGREKETAIKQAMATSGDTHQQSGFLLGYALGKSV